jgi:predicted ABC-type ATPase
LPAGAADRRPPRCLYVLAGANGAGKSSIGGAMLLQRGVEHFNPDDASRLILAANPGIDLTTANSAAWHEGVRLLQRAIDERASFAFETTLGGRTITTLLERALSKGLEVRVWYVGLRDPELHVARVRARVARGGHAIAEETIRRRYDNSRLNLIRLLPHLTELRLYDNSRDADPMTGHTPRPLLILHVVHGSVITACDPAATPDWAKPIVAAAML